MKTRFMRLVTLLLAFLFLGASSAIASEEKPSADLDSLMADDFWGAAWGDSPYEVTNTIGVSQAQLIMDTGMCSLFYDASAEWGEDAKVTLRFNAGLDFATLEFATPTEETQKNEIMESINSLIHERTKIAAATYVWETESKFITLDFTDDKSVLIVCPSKINAAADKAPSADIGKSFVMEKGEWIVGPHLPEGEFKLTASDHYAAITVTGTDGWPRDAYWIDEDDVIGRMVLIEGEQIKIEHGEIEFTPFE